MESIQEKRYFMATLMALASAIVVFVIIIVFADIVVSDTYDKTLTPCKITFTGDVAIIENNDGTVYKVYNYGAIETLALVKNGESFNATFVKSPINIPGRNLDTQIYSVTRTAGTHNQTC